MTGTPAGRDLLAWLWRVVETLSVLARTPTQPSLGFDLAARRKQTLRRSPSECIGQEARITQYSKGEIRLTTLTAWVVSVHSPPNVRSMPIWKMKYTR